MGSVQARLRPLLEQGDIATCSIVDLEVLFSATRFVDYEQILEERASLPQAPITPEVLARAIGVQHELAKKGQHRIPIADLVIAAAAEGASMTILHYDSDFETISLATGQPHEWVVPQGSV